MIINYCFGGSFKSTRNGAGGLGLMVLGAGRVVGRRHMPENVTEPEKLGQVCNLTLVPEVIGDILSALYFAAES